MLDLAQTLSQTTALPLQDEPPPPAPTPRAPGRAGWGCLLCVVGLIGLGNAYSWYECRGAHFPVRPGAPLVIDHRMGTCTVRSLEVTAGQSYRRTGGCGSEGSGVCFYDVTPYAISLDIENTGSKPSTLHFVVGFGASNRTEGDSGPLQPHTHRRVTVNLEKSGDAPKDLFLRADG